jgi:hypothetical protein
MKTSTMPYESSVARVYKTSANPSLQASGVFLAVFFFGFAALLIFGLMSRFGFSPEIALGSAILIGIGIYGLYLASGKGKFVYFVLSDEGIRYEAPGFSIETKWENVARVELTPSVPRYSLSLILKQPVLISDPAGSMIAGVKCSTLPLSMFSLVDTVEIRVDIRHFAPKLFAE